MCLDRPQSVDFVKEVSIFLGPDAIYVQPPTHVEYQSVRTNLELQT